MTGSDGWYRMPKIVYFYTDSMAYVRFGIPALGEWVASKIQKSYRGGGTSPRLEFLASQVTSVILIDIYT
jgi:hypothetical protein